MDDEARARELSERLDVIEAMIAAGRRSTERWGWAFVLWGIAYMVAMAWSRFAGGSTGAGGGSGGTLAWPITMATAAVATVLIAATRGGKAPGTAAGRTVTALWTGIGAGMLVLFFGLGFSGRLEPQVFVAAIGALLGAANASSGMILRWRMQWACGLVWWAVAMLACFGSAAQAWLALAVGAIVCLILFGAYAMVLDARNARRSRLVHG